MSVFADLRLGDHVCLPVGSDDEALDAATEFASFGLNRNYQVVLLSDAIAAVRQDGVGGLAKILDEDLLADLLRAVGSDAVWARLFAGEADRQAVIAAIAGVIREYRVGGFVPVDVLLDRLGGA